ncbi:hypothetical protein LOC68_13450 [Blastopirellula sp. JC732]|uniref:Uncharacterized protein n=1 Tax=Blastopirellula sediminis TaxID=2894196 RepID=A0A9X1MNF2_9BACT|nr:hypothetical protein [Blastopirellula sediminis]MCC9607307.1 hypothetical protein [Blastopirellula sediminis]MCC9629400.1 hypothetical protein [Blastopirellula sediminis]
MLGSSRRLLLALGLLAIAVCVGCNVHVSDRGETFSCCNNPLESVGFFFGGLGLAGLGWLSTSFSSRLGFVMIILGAMGVLYMAPASFFESGKVDAEGYRSTSGFLGLSKESVKFDEIESVQLVTEESRGRRGRINYDDYIVCRLKDGAVTKFDYDAKVQHAAGSFFLKACQKKGITVTEQRPGNRQDNDWRI